MVTHNEFGFWSFSFITVMEDLQLFSFIVASQIHSLVYLFNPLLFFVRKFTWPIHILIFCNLLTIISCIIYSVYSFNRGRFRSLVPLRLLRILSLLIPTVLFIPTIETLAHPIACGKPTPELENEAPRSFAEGYEHLHVVCHSTQHYLLLTSSAVASLFIIPFCITMASLFYDPDPKSKVGKTTGNIDAIYVTFRVVLILLNDILPSRIVIPPW
jgi:hypothetical protein